MKFIVIVILLAIAILYQISSTECLSPNRTTANKKAPTIKPLTFTRAVNTKRRRTTANPRVPTIKPLTFTRRQITTRTTTTTTTTTTATTTSKTTTTTTTTTTITTTTTTTRGMYSHKNIFAKSK